jgi:hypothetical protein
MMMSIKRGGWQFNGKADRLFFLFFLMSNSYSESKNSGSPFPGSVMENKDYYKI